MSNKNGLEDVIDEEFLTPVKFSMMIEKNASDRGVSLVDYITTFCEERMIDPEEIKHLLSRSVKDKLEVEFQEMNYLRKGATLDTL